MEISALISYQKVQASYPGPQKAYSRNDAAKNGDTVAVSYERTELSIELKSYDLDEIKKNKETEKSQLSAPANAVKLKAEIHNEIMEQVKVSLGAFFEDNPDAIEEVANGQVPEYFNVENTARRILDIYFRYYEEGEDKQQFVDRAKGIIGQAYSDVAAIVGDFPDIVSETREQIMNVLDRFAAGEDVSEFMQYEIK